jgi:uncharacterized membrane protein YebE (DUF533 family)
MPDSPGFLEVFKENPLFLLVALLLGAVALGAGGIGVLIGRKSQAGAAVSAIAAVIALAALGMGGLASWQIHRATEQTVTVAGLTEKDRERIRTYASASANVALTTAGIAALPGLVIGAIGVALALRRR